MKKPGRLIPLGLAVAAVLSLPGCNRAKDARSFATAPVSSTASSNADSPVKPVIAAATPVPAVPAPVSASISNTGQQVKTGDTPAAGQNPKVTATDKSQTLTVWQHNFRLITHVLTIEGTTDQTVGWWELRDANDRVVHHADYPAAFQNGSFESTLDISASAFNTSQGGGILIHGFELPSAPNSGGWVQVFGYKYGREKYGVDPSLFGSFGVISEEFLDVRSDESRPSPTMLAGGATMTVMHDILRFRLWTGNFNLVYPVLVNWITGKLEPAARCLEMTSKGRVERCTYPITVEDPVRATEPTFVRLFPEPDDGGATPKHVIVQPQSKIEYVEARVPIGWAEDSNSISFGVDGDVWLKVRIDGQEGWIHSEEDFQAVGLPQSG